MRQEWGQTRSFGGVGSIPLPVHYLLFRRLPLLRADLAIKKSSTTTQQRCGAQAHQQPQALHVWMAPAWQEKM
jgi:hypothetical protein